MKIPAASLTAYHPIAKPRLPVFGGEPQAVESWPRHWETVVRRTQNLSISDEALEIIRFHLADVKPGERESRLAHKLARKELTTLFTERYQQFLEDIGVMTKVEMARYFKRNLSLPPFRNRYDVPINLSLEMLYLLQWESPHYLNEVFEEDNIKYNGLGTFSEIHAILEGQLKAGLAEKLPETDSKMAVQLIYEAGEKAIRRVKNRTLMREVPKAMLYLAGPALALQLLARFFR